MSQRIKPDRPIWPPLPETGARPTPSTGPSEAPRAAPPQGGSGPGASGPRAQRVAPATVEAFGSLAG
ncbi:hypothetical protein [Methylobacterium radiodurans]|uniref:Uncharacterized protein n=1 Tax=Methylobacterium radiodurans TaxID=2202828 RepID=A0A2U8VUY0_9HYPH|nr:hypothetical protein [Methylobacterium radiodurans]AWN37052.1 hypothetical protein DK427_16030 [Methylobacterium radiodurans]